MAQSYRSSTTANMVARVSTTELLAQDANLRPRVWAAGTMESQDPDLGELYRAARRAEDVATRNAQQLDNLTPMMRLMR